MGVFELVNIFMSFALVLIGYLLRIVWESIKRLQNDMAELERHTSETYVRRDDYREDMNEVKSMLRQVIDAVNKKVDR
jgi:uncharacterized protein YoxC